MIKKQLNVDIPIGFDPRLREDRLREGWKRPGDAFTISGGNNFKIKEFKGFCLKSYKKV